MSRVKVLFFAADPLSADGRAQRLLLDEEVRQIRRGIQAARYRDALDLDVHLATRTKDLMHALNRTRPQVVHFSGHGTSEGLVLAGVDGRSGHSVGTAGLTRLFEVFRGDVRVVVLNACFSRPQAEAIANIVGCAIGTRREISDAAAITFGATFYQAIAFGVSVQTAYDQARAALELDHFADQECPDLVARPDVDPSGLVLVADPAPSPGSHRGVVPRRVAAAAAAFVLTFVPEITRPAEPPGLSVSDLACGADSRALGIRPRIARLPDAGSAAPTDPSGPAEDLADARAFYQAGNYAEAARAFERAARAGNGEAMGCLGYLYLYGRGVEPQADLGIYWLRRAARDERDAHGMYALAVAYQNGDGVDRAGHWAEYWFRAAAEKGYAEAMRSLGSLYQQERNDSSYHQALEWYRKAEKAGSVDARVDIGLMYELGLGTAPNPAEALRWYRSAAAAGSARGMFAVAESYEKGVGVPRDRAQAKAWSRRAAKAGLPGR